MRRNPIHFDENDRIELAKVVLLRIVTKPMSIGEIYQICKAEQSLTKGEVKAARKALGLRSYEEDGVRYWAPNPADTAEVET